MSTNYEVLLELESILKADIRTKDYSIQAGEDPDDLPGPEGCPYINIFPRSKNRALARMSGTPYTATTLFDILCWEVSVDDFKDVFKQMVLIEENVFAVLSDNISINGKVLTSEIGETIYESIYYDSTFYIKTIIPFSVQTDQ